MKLADNNDMHKISDKLENASYQTNNGRVTSPSFSKMAILDIVNSVAASDKFENGSDQTYNDRDTSP